MSWLQRKRNVVSPWWATATLAWVCLQGAFGALTVTMKLYPAVVSAHLLGGIALLALLAVQAQAYLRRPLAMPRRLYFATLVVLILSVLQIALGAWVSTNYAVLACSDFPTCQGSWWPVMDFEQSFVLWRELGQTSDGRWLPFATLTAIHYVHRLAAYVVLAAIALLAWSLMQLPAMRKWGWALIGVMLWQLASGLANILLGWPLLAAVAHTGGAAVLVTLLAVLVTRARQAHLSLHQAS